MLRMFSSDAIRYKLRQSSVVLLTAALMLSALAPMLLSGGVSAAQLSARSITMGSSERGQADVTYTVTFTPETTATIEGIVIEFCANSPLIGASCTTPANGNTLEGFDINDTTLAVTAGWTVDTTNSDPNRLVITHAGDSFVDGTPETITLGAGGGSDGITNPTYDGIAPATFYARILTYDTDTVAQAYESATPGAYTDYGGIALSTASQLTVNARVQEELEFCIGAIAGTIDTDAEAPANCTDNAFDTVASPTVDIGVVSSAASSVSPVAASSGGNDLNGAALIRTNGNGGASITYFAEQDTSSGRLKVASATCSGSTAGFDTGSSSVDQCFNSNNDQDNAANDFNTAGEKFGMTISSVLRPTGSTTTNLTRDGEYDGDANPATAGGDFAWDSTGTTDVIATSSTVLDYEMLVLRFAARAAATTPTGFYAVTSTYVATPIF